MRYRIKIIPKAAPNNDGEWREVETPEIRESTCWLDYVAALGDFVPETHFLAAAEVVEAVRTIAIKSRITIEFGCVEYGLPQWSSRSIWRIPQRFE